MMGWSISAAMPISRVKASASETRAWLTAWYFGMV